MTVRLEHANLCVRDIDVMIKFLLTAFPEFRIRQDATGEDGSRWVHVGTENTYFALKQATAEQQEKAKPYGKMPGINHLGLEVEDVEALRERLAAAGYKDSTYPNAHPHRKRVYFNDPEGGDWEFVQYLSDDLTKRNDYELPDR